MSAFVVPRSNFSPKRREKSIGAFVVVSVRRFAVRSSARILASVVSAVISVAERLVRETLPAFVCESYVIRFDVGEGHCAVRGRDGQLFFEFQVAEFYVAVG